MQKKDKISSSGDVINTPLTIVIEGKKFETLDQYKSGAELKALAGIPLNATLYLSIREPYLDELIENDKVVNLARPDIEHFYVQGKLKLSINGQHFFWYEQYITGLQIRQLGNVGIEEKIYLEIDEPYEDELISDQEKVNLARPGKESFVSREDVVLLIVNASPKSWTQKSISFKQLVELAFGDYVDTDTTVYTVTYKNGPHKNPQGSMVKGDIVRVKNKMIFNVAATDRS